MRILYLSQYFPPEVGATQTRAYEMARHLVSAGHQVTMIAEAPNHPSGIIPPEYRRRLYECATLDGIQVIRVWVKASPKKTFSTRMVFYLSYMVSATLVGLALRSRYDLIYATSPPLFVGGAAVALSALRRLPLAFEVRDLWPESAVALGEISNARAAAWAGKLEELCYNRAARIVVVTRGIRRRLEERGFGSKLALIPNGANTELFRPDPEGGAKLRAELGLTDKFVAIYAGIHGVAQGLETVLESAQELVVDAPDIHFLFVGEGPRKADLLARRNQLGLHNVTMLSEKPRSQLPAYLSAADIALVPLRSIALFEGALPSKMFDAWACACPVLLSIDGEAREVLEQAEAGVFVEPENARQMAQALSQLRNEPGKLRRYGDSGRSFVEAHYSRQRLAEQLEALLKEILQH